MHIRALAIFELPDDAAPTFVRDLHEAFAQMAYLHFHSTASLPAERPWPTGSRWNPTRATTSASRLCPDLEPTVIWVPWSNVCIPHLWT